MRPKRFVVFEEKNLTIVENIIETEKHFIQIANITQVWKDQLPRKPLPIVAISLLFVIGIILFGFVALFQAAIFLGVLLIGIACLLIFLNRKQIIIHTLNLEVSSGSVYAFTSPQEEFLFTAYQTIAEILKNPQNSYKSVTNISFLDQTINHNNENNITEFNINDNQGNIDLSKNMNTYDNNLGVINQDKNFTAGSDNKVSISNSITNEIDKNLPEILKQFEELVNQRSTKMSNEENEKISQAVKALEENDLSTFEKIVKKIPQMLLDVGAGIFTGVVVELIKKIGGIQ